MGLSKRDEDRVPRGDPVNHVGPVITLAPNFGDVGGRGLAFSDSGLKRMVQQPEEQS